MIFLLLLCSLSVINSCFGMNLSRPYEFFFKPSLYGARMAFSGFIEKGIKPAHGFDEQGCSVNVLRLWERNQNGIAMLKGFDESSEIGQLLDRIQGVDIAPVDDGRRGHFCVSGDMKLLYNMGLCYKHCLPLDFVIGVYLPITSMELTNVCWQNLTDPQLPTDPDRRVQEYLANDFFCNVKRLGKGLELGGWKRTGIGDLTILLEWARDFPQQKPLLKNVHLNVRIGPMLPTGKKADEDKIFAVPFGNDGSLGLLFGGMMRLTWGCYMKAGFDVELIHAFGTLRNRRIKTDLDQTEFLLLEKTCVFKDWGLTQQFNLFLEAHHFYKGWSLLADYEFVKQGETKLSVVPTQFSSEIANSALGLEEWTSHYFMAKASYEFGHEKECGAKPELSLFAKVPFNGKGSALFTTVGVIGTVRF